MKSILLSNEDMKLEVMHEDNLNVKINNSITMT